MNPKKSSIIVLSSEFIINTFFVIFSLAVITIVAYFFGFRIISNPLSGNDAMNNLTYASWIAEHYPRIPLWYPLAGGGTSFLIGYPSLYSFSVALLHRNSSLTLIQAMGVLNFACLLLPAWGVFAFVWMRFRMRPAALLSSIFYLLSPISYVLISGAGFLSHAYSYIFSVPLLIFYDIYLDSWLNNKNTAKKLFALIISGIFFVLTTLAHPVSSLGFMVLFGFYSLLLGFSNDGLKGMKRGFIAILTAAVIYYLLSFFWFKPFQDFTAFSNRDITFTANTETLPPVRFMGMLGLIGPQTHYPFPNLSVVPFIWIMGFIGTIIGLVKKNYKLFILGLLVFFCIYLMGTYTIWIALTKIHWLLGSFFVNRYYYTATALLPPIVAGVGLWYLVTLPLVPLIRILKRRSNYISVPVNFIFSLTGIISVVALTFAGLYYLNNFSGYHMPDRPYMMHYGEEAGVGIPFIWNRSLDGLGVRDFCDKTKSWYAGIFCENPALRGKVDISTLVFYCEEHGKNNSEGKVDICSAEKLAVNKENLKSGYPFVTEFLNKCQQGNYESVYYRDLCLSVGVGIWDQLKHWPAVRLSNLSLDKLETAEFSNPLSPLNFISKPNTRIDVTPGIGTWVKEWNVLNRSSIINAYTGQLVLNKSFQSYFRDIIYSADLVKSSSAVSEAAKYYGTSAIISAKNDQSSKFKKEQWTDATIKKDITLWKPGFKTSIYEYLTSKNVLAIGASNKQAYKQIFQLATLGVIPYEKALLFEGKEFIDSYSQEELNRYNLIVLHGYSYKNKNKAFSLLKQYIEGGGNVFVDTGWQYVSKDWGGEKGTEFPDWFPVRKIKWGSAGDSWSNAKLDGKLLGSISTSGFNPLTWEEASWGLSYADSNNLAGVALITISEKVVVAKNEVGKGKIVWSGMNLPAHALNPENANEIQLLKSIFDDLIPEKKVSTPAKYTIERLPDKLDIIFQNDVPKGTFYFKEAYHPYWKAVIIKRGSEKKTELPISPAGPRFMGVILDELQPGDILTITFETSRVFLLTSTVSVLTLTVLIFLFIDTLLTGGRIVRSLPLKNMKTQLPGTHILKRQIRKVKDSAVKDEEDY